MECSWALMVVLVVAGCFLQDANGHYYRKRYSSYPRMYAGSRYRGYHSGYRYRPQSHAGLRTIFSNIYRHFKDRDDDNMNIIDDDRPAPVVIRLPSSVVNDPNFKMADLPFYLSSGIFDTQNLPGGAGAFPTPIVDPINPTGIFDDDDDLNNNLNQILGGGGNNILGGANTNLLGGGGSNLIGGAGNNLLSGANTNLLGGANTNVLGGANTNLLGGTNGNLLGGAGTNLLGGANTNVLAGAGTNILGGSNTNLLGQGGQTGVLPGAGSNTDFFNTKTG